MRSATLDDVFFALSNATRRDIVARLSRGSARIQEIADPFDVSLNTVSKHIKVLERAGLVRRRIRGREHICQLQAAPLRLVNDFVEEYEPFWSDRLATMESLLTATDEKKSP